jgi:hypothetical protein
MRQPIAIDGRNFARAEDTRSGTSVRALSLILLLTSP